MYTVIGFEDGIIAVPTSWIDHKKRICKWPPYSNEDIEESIRNVEEVKDTWIELPIISTFGKPVNDLVAAKEKVKLAMMVSDCDDEEQLKKSRHKRKQKRISSSSESSEDNTITKTVEKIASTSLKLPSKLLKSITTFPVSIQNIKAKNVANNDVTKRPTSRNNNYFDSSEFFSSEDIFAETENAPPDNQHVMSSGAKNTNVKSVAGITSIKSTTKTAGSTSMADTSDKKLYKFLTYDEKLNYMIGLQEENIQKNNAILTEIRQMWNYVRKGDEHDKQKVIENITGSRSETIDNAMNMMPIKNFDELDLLEKKLKSPEFKNVMNIFYMLEKKTFSRIPRLLNCNKINILKKRGGKNADELTNNIMAKIFSDELAADFSFRGRQKKRPFLELTICSCIIEAVTTSEGTAKEDLVQKQMGKWLANAPLRLSRKKSKQETKIRDARAKNDEDQ